MAHTIIFLNKENHSNCETPHHRDKKFAHKFQIGDRIFLNVYQTKLDFSSPTFESDKSNF